MPRHVSHELVDSSLEGIAGRGQLIRGGAAEPAGAGLGVTIGGTMVNAFKSEAGIATNASFQITFVIVGLITLVSAWVFRKMDPRYFS